MPTGLGDNPFYVLGVKTDASRVEIEREGARLLAMLEVGLSSAATFKSPLGDRPRTADKVRIALAELRDPDKRLVHELWASASPAGPAPAPAGSAPAPAPPGSPAPWPEAFEALGWSPRRA